MSYHVFLVAIAYHPNGIDIDREEAEQDVLEMLASGLMKDMAKRGDVSWWIAEDDRHDGSDNDSAVFVDVDAQQRAFDLLVRHGLTGTWNNPSHARS